MTKAMKRTSLAVLFAVAITGSAFAADMPLKAPSAPVPVWTWSGFYLGANIGAIWNNTKETVQPAGGFLTPAFVPANPLRTDSATFDDIGLTVGTQVGYNWQVDRLVLGVETDLNFSSLNERNSVNRPLAAPLVLTINHAETEQLDWFGTIRGRLGVVLSPALLLYGTGGLAYGGINSSSTVFFASGGDTYAGSVSSTRTGWTVGGGGEWMVSPGWSVKAEYLHIDLGSVSSASLCTTPAAACTSIAPPPAYQTVLKVRDDVFRLGVNYHLGAPH
jgi:outer membrane immunogenic protein